MTRDYKRIMWVPGGIMYAEQLNQHQDSLINYINYRSIIHNGYGIISININHKSLKEKIFSINNFECILPNGSHLYFNNDVHTYSLDIDLPDITIETSVKFYISLSPEKVIRATSIMTESGLEDVSEYDYKIILSDKPTQNSLCIAKISMKPSGELYCVHTGESYLFLSKDNTILKYHDKVIMLVEQYTQHLVNQMIEWGENDFRIDMNLIYDLCLRICESKYSLDTYMLYRQIYNILLSMENSNKRITTAYDHYVGCSQIYNLQNLILSIIKSRYNVESSVFVYNQETSCWVSDIVMKHESEFSIIIRPGMSKSNKSWIENTIIGSKSMIDNIKLDRNYGFQRQISYVSEEYIKVLVTCTSKYFVKDEAITLYANPSMDLDIVRMTIIVKK